MSTPPSTLSDPLPAAAAAAPPLSLASVEAKLAEVIRTLAEARAQTQAAEARVQAAEARAESQAAEARAQAQAAEARAQAQAAEARAQTQAAEARAQAQAAEARAGELSDRVTELAEANLRQKFEHSLSALVSRNRNHEEESAIKSSLENTALSGTPVWVYDPRLFDTLRTSEDPTCAVSRLVCDAVAAARCTPAPQGSSERPSETCPKPHDVHSHVRRAVDAAISVLAGSAKLPGWDDALHTRRVTALYESSYNNHGGMPIPDHSAVSCECGIPQLTPESQVGAVEDKIFAILRTDSPCPGELQLAGYAAQPLFSPISCGINLANLASAPLSSNAIYTDSTTATLVQVHIGSDIRVLFCRMPFLPDGDLPKETACVAEGGDSFRACGVVAFALGVMAALRDTRLRAAGATAEIAMIAPLPSGVSFPRDSSAPFIGRGRSARVFDCRGFAVKLPLSRQAFDAPWSEGITAEAGMLTSLLAHPTHCQHFPRLAVPVTTQEASARVKYAGVSAVDFCISAEGAAALSSQMKQMMGKSNALVTSPLLTMLPQVINDLRSRLPLAARSLPALLTLTLAIALPLISAQAHARLCVLSHGDAHAMNVGLEGWDADAAASLLLSVAPPAHLSGGPPAEGVKCVRVGPSSALLESACTLDGVGGASLHDAASVARTSAAMCRSVVLNDWGCARRIGTRGFSMAAAVVQDTTQVLALVRYTLRMLLDDMTIAELLESLVTPEVVRWWVATSERCRSIASSLSQAAPMVTTDDVRQCVLRALGLAPMGPGAPSSSKPCTRSSERKRAAAAAAAEPSMDDPLWISLDANAILLHLQRLCARATTAPLLARRCLGSKCFNTGTGGLERVRDCQAPRPSAKV